MKTPQETQETQDAHNAAVHKAGGSCGTDSPGGDPGAPLRALLLYTVCGAFLYAICAGFRDNYGIMLPYIVAFSGISYATVSFIIALGQLLFGAMQPVFGLLALRYGARFTLFLGAAMMLAGLLLIPFSSSTPMLTLALGVLLPSGTAAASFGMIMGLIVPRVSSRQGHTISGFVAAGIGMGICILSPIIQSMIAAHGLLNAVLVLTGPLLMLFPASWLLTRTPKARARGAGVPQSSDAMAQRAARADLSLAGAREIFSKALHNDTYRRLTLGFFTCGFHMALIQTHLFSQLTTFGVTEQAAAYALSVYGIGVICGGIGSGLACVRFAMPQLLAWLYASRCLWAALLLMPLPLPALFVLIFLLGATGPATLAPTAGQTQQLFGPARLATLFGFVYLVHQIGAFCSAWAGGLCRQLTGNYGSVWYVDIALCLVAALACWGIKHKEEVPRGTEA